MKYMKKRTKVSAHLISSISGVLSEGENIINNFNKIVIEYNYLIINDNISNQQKTL